MKKRNVRSGDTVQKPSKRQKRWKARVDTGKPTLAQQGIDVDEFICENHALIERLRKGKR